MKFVYSFEDGPKQRAKELLGGKGAGLAEMVRLGIAVPPGFVVSTAVCQEYYANDQRYPAGLEAEVDAALRGIEEKLGRRLGDPAQPLLVSVRSGARVSMPGMMDTVLNLGLNDETVEGLARVTGNRRFAFDSYRRFIAMYGEVVLGVRASFFEDALTEEKAASGDPHMADPDLSAESLSRLVERYKQMVAEQADAPFPLDAKSQLWGAMGAVFRSWNNKRAVVYRRMHGYSDAWGTAVTVQAMVFGNLGDDCATGVAFTRNPSNGERRLYGEFLRNAQGEDVVAGIRTPRPLSVQSAEPGREDDVLERVMPEAFAELSKVFQKLERHFRDMQDVEFTIERGKVWVLQTRTGKRTALASVRIAVEMVAEGLIDKAEAVLRVDPWAVDQLLHPQVPAPETLAQQGIASISTGLPASPGAAIGQIVFDADAAEKLAKDGHKVVLVRRETSPEDITGMKAAEGILTAAGGMTSHAAVVARGMGKPCVVGCSALHVDYRSGRLTARTEHGSQELKEGDVITIDGSRGRVYRGEVPVEPAAVSGEFETLMGWVDSMRRMRVLANADTPQSAQAAKRFGAEGIGLCRTEHMFFAEERLQIVRCIFLSDNEEAREQWTRKLEPIQRADFVEIFRAMDGLPVTIRLLDWPLHEFMPHEPEEFESIAQALGSSAEAVDRRARALSEQNPMLGHRGVRLGLTHPQVYETQVRAVVKAAADCLAEGLQVRAEIMVPLVGLSRELASMRERIERVIDEVRSSKFKENHIAIGTMIELPRACVTAGAIAEHADFFSFGTNDLTQTTLGLSRDDAAQFLPAYLGDGLRLLEVDPFATLDVEGVGALMRMAAEQGRKIKPALKLGVCGEHGGDPTSIEFCEELGLDYVSCSPFRVPIARLAAAQAALRRKATGKVQSPAG